MAFPGKANFFWGIGALYATAMRAARGAVGWARGLDTHLAGLLLALAAPVFWSTSGLFIKVLAIEPLPLAGLRCFMAGAVFAPFVRGWRVRPGLELVLLFAVYTALSFAFVTATRWTTAANAIALQSTAPAWVFLVSCLMARAVPWRFTAPIGIILGGVVIILMEPTEGTSFQGNLLGSFCGIAVAMVTILFARMRRPVLEVVAKINLAAALLLFLLDPSSFRFTEYTPGEWVSLVYLGTIQIGFGFICFHGALKRLNTTHVAVLTLLEPLLNPVWVFLAIGEVPSRFGLAGGGLIITGVFVDALLRHMDARAARRAGRSAGGPQAG